MDRRMNMSDINLRCRVLRPIETLESRVPLLCKEVYILQTCHHFPVVVHPNELQRKNIKNLPNHPNSDVPSVVSIFPYILFQDQSLAQRKRSKGFLDIFSQKPFSSTSQNDRKTTHNNEKTTQHDEKTTQNDDKRHITMNKQFKTMKKQPKTIKNDPKR